MSLFGALDTSVSGLNSQSAAFGDISANVANSQTVGYKRVDTAFGDYLTQASSTTYESGSTVPTPVYENTVQGSVTQSDNPLALAITGNGFFSVNRPIADNGTTITPSTQTFYTRQGDFQLNKEGYLVNSSGDYLNGWAYNNAVSPPTLNASNAVPVQVAATIDAPVATSNVTLDANLPAADTSTTALTSTVEVYDAQGAAHTLSLNFTPTAGTPNSWDLTVKDDGTVASESGTPATIGEATLVFDSAGALSSLTGVGSTTTSGAAAGTTASVTLATQYPNSSGTQNIALNLGTIGGTSGLTQFASASAAYTLRGVSQDGAPPGAFTGLSTTAAGDIVANFDNGQTRNLYRVPVVTFPDANALQSQNNNAYTATVASGNPLAHDAGTEGAGTLVTSATEASNVDIGKEMTNLIVAQQAYTANAKMVTSADQLLQTTINMKQ